MTKSILVVDDELEFFELLQFRFRDCSYQLLHAPNATQGLYQAQHHLPDVILMDLLLPDLDGLTLCAELRGHPATRALPVIFISAVATDVTRHAAEVAGACAYFMKPLDFDGLKTKLRSVLATPKCQFGMESLQV